MKIAQEREFAFGDRDQQVRTDRRPDLDSDAVGACGEESAQAQVLFDPAEEQLDLPAAAVDGGDDQCGQGEVVGQKDERQIVLCIKIADTPREIR